MISIHVPAWGTTYQILQSLRLLPISIHVPAWGTTLSASVIQCKYDYFNPRSRVGNDSASVFSSVFISFQSTFPRGERLYNRSHTNHLPLFQSTFPRGERQRLILIRSISTRYFNPRSRVGNDYIWT